MRDLYWMGDSRKELQEFPKKVSGVIGYALHQAQNGYMSHNAKPFTGLPGVFEIVAPFNKNTYRVVYALKIGLRIYVLHIFQKKSKTGVATPLPEIELIRSRFKDAKRLEEENA